jgi:hypothetical protein
VKIRLLEQLRLRRGRKTRFAPPQSATARFRFPQLPSAWKQNGQKNFLVLGNCQARALATSLQALCPTATFTGVELPSSAARRLAQRDVALIRALQQFDGILAHAAAMATVSNLPELAGKVMRIPFIGFAAYHPDLVYINTTRDGAPDYLFGPMGHYHSAIAFWAYLRGLNAAETVSLFNAASYEALDYFNFWQTSRHGVLHEGEAAGLMLHENIERWTRGGCFMHSINHPKIRVFNDLAPEFLRRLGLPMVPEAAQFVVDEFAAGPVWPVYPEIAQRLAVEGSYLFKIERGRAPAGRSVVMLDLRDFVEASFEAFGAYDRDQLTCERLQSGRFEALASLLVRRSTETNSTAPTAPVPRRTPYSDLPPHQFWKTAVASVPWQEVDPVVRGRFKVSRMTRIATAGSCFAQHISATLQRYGFNYYVPEAGTDLSSEEARRRQFGVYSARYGNVYTARQLLQLFERAYGRFQPVDTVWQRQDGRFIDPFRPFIEPDGWDSAEAVEQARWRHLLAVREMFENLEVLIFTLGLTEAWRSKIDGAVLPVAPGVAGEVTDMSRYEFVNFGVADVVADLNTFIESLRAVNSTAKVILTVSPVPLIATYEPQHALVATTYSKSVLRAAAGDICARHENCAYFPSYEIITGNYARGAYYEADLRTVTSAGVEHVMRLFLKHYASEQSLDSIDPALAKELNSVAEIICDEQALGS